MAKRRTAMNSHRKRDAKRRLHAVWPFCFVCGHPLKLSVATIEHIVPLGAGGTDRLSNLALSHRPCNRKRGMAGYKRAA